MKTFGDLNYTSNNRTSKNFSYSNNKNDAYKNDNNKNHSHQSDNNKKYINRKVIFLKRIIILSLVLSIIFLYIELHDTGTIDFVYVLKTISLSILVSILVVNYLRIRKKNRLLNSDIFDVDKMSGVDFELFLYYQLKSMGYKVRLTPVTHDFGADLILKHRKEKTIIQAKRWNESVGIKAVQEIVGAINYYNADYAMVMTNSIFTKSAKILADANYVQLIDRKALIQMLETGEIGNTLEEDSRKEGICPFCGSTLVRRNGYYGEFYGCSSYPGCKFTKQC